MTNLYRWAGPVQGQSYCSISLPLSPFLSGTDTVRLPNLSEGQLLYDLSPIYTLCNVIFVISGSQLGCPQFHPCSRLNKALVMGIPAVVIQSCTLASLTGEVLGPHYALELGLILGSGDFVAAGSFLCPECPAPRPRAVSPAEEEGGVGTPEEGLQGHPQCPWNSRRLCRCQTTSRSRQLLRALSVGTVPP